MVSLITAPKIKSWLPRRSLDAHKGNCGRIYILAGSRGMVGAGILSSGGAVAAGAGLVRLGTVQSQQRIAANRAPLEVTTDSLPENKSGHLDKKKLIEIEQKILQFDPDVVALGPGLGKSIGLREIVQFLLRLNGRAFVLDADGLNVFPKRDRRFSRNPVIITPHPGELARLLGRSTHVIQMNRIKSAQEAARKFKCVCLLKGHKTIVTDGKNVWQNTTGDSLMASAGMGDVLTGIIAALWGQMPNKNFDSGLKAAVLGAYLHGIAGVKAAKKIGGLSVQASRLADFIPAAIRNLKGGKL